MVGEQVWHGYGYLSGLRHGFLWLPTVVPTGCTGNAFVGPPVLVFLPFGSGVKIR